MKHIRCLLFCFTLLTLNPAIALSAVHLGASGSWAKNYLGMQTHTSNSYKGSIAVDFLSYFRLGYSFRQAFQHREGFEDADGDEATEEVIYFEQDVKQDIHSVDLFAILYADEHITPYIFGGIALKSFDIKEKKEGEEETHATIGPLPFPNYGIGLAIALSRSFSLKITSTWSDMVAEDRNGKQRKVRDSQVDLGISYQID